ncbi:hypothetical protein ACDX78_13700 [Virgibacillus oceani]
MDIQHPDISKMHVHGLPEMQPVNTDKLGHEIYPGDDIISLNDEVFLVEPLMQETIEILEKLGAEHEIA